MSVVVIGTAVVDVIGYAERRPRAGETLVGTGYTVSAGGKGLNQAIAAARAGASAALMAAIGDDEFGARLSRTLAGEGVDPAAVMVRPELPTGVGLPIVTDDGDNSIVVVPGASSAIGIDHHDWLDANVGPRSIFVSQLELPLDVVAPALAAAVRRGATIMLNPAPAADIAALLPLTHVLVPNNVEAEALTGEVDPVEAAKRIASWKHGMDVIVTCGADGAVLVTGGVVERIPAPRVDAVDTVGAGDVFCGYLAAGLAGGVAILDAVVDAVQAASVSVTRRGAATSAPHRAELTATR